MYRFPDYFIVSNGILYFLRFKKLISKVSKQKEIHQAKTDTTGQISGGKLRFYHKSFNHEEYLKE
jgi:hypothetical protein